MKYSLRRATKILAISISSLFIMAQFNSGVVADELSKTVDPVKQAAWEAAQAQAAKRVADFDAAVKSGTPQQIRKAGLDLQSDPIAVQKINQTRPDLVASHNQVTQKIKSAAKANIQDNMANEWNKAHPNEPPITRKDIRIYEPTNYKDPSAKPKSGQDWDVTVQVKPKGAKDFVDVPPTQSQKIVEKSYYDAAGGEKTFGKRAPDVTPEQAAAAAAHRQAVETTYGKSPEAYNQPKTILGEEGVKPKTSERLSDPEQLTHAIENKSIQSGNKAAKELNPAEAVRQEFEQMRQASKQYDKITKPRVEAAGGTVNTQVEKGMNILRDAGAGNISPEQARAKLAEMGETPESMISKASGQAEAAQKLKPSGVAPETTKSTGTTPEPTGKNASAEGSDAPKVKGTATEPTSVKSKIVKGVGTVMIGVDIGSTAEDIKEDLKKGDIQGAATKAGEAGANAVTGGGYGTVKTGLDKYNDATEAKNQIANANKQNEAAYDLQVQKKLREAGASPEEVAKIMDAKAKGDDSVLESKLKQLGVRAPEKIVEKAPVGDDTVKDRAASVGTGMVESAEKAGKFAKETVQDVTEITTGITEKGVATEIIKQTKGNVADAYETYKANKNAESTEGDFKQGVINDLIAKGATPEGAQKAANALVDDKDPSKLKKLNEILDNKNKKSIPVQPEVKPESLAPTTKRPETGIPETGLWQRFKDAVTKGKEVVTGLYDKFKAEKEKVIETKSATKDLADDKVVSDKTEAETPASEPDLPANTHEEVGGWVEDKNGKTRLTYIKDKNGKVLSGYNTHFDSKGNETARDTFNVTSESPGLADDSAASTSTGQKETTEKDIPEQNATEPGQVDGAGMEDNPDQTESVTTESSESSGSAASYAEPTSQIKRKHRRIASSPVLEEIPAIPATKPEQANSAELESDPDYIELMRLTQEIQPLANQATAQANAGKIPSASTINRLLAAASKTTALSKRLEKKYGDKYLRKNKSADKK